MIAPERPCSNCGAQTPQHAFCAECGVALSAQPKPLGGAGVTAQRRHVLSRSRIVGVAVFFGLVVVAAGIIGALAPPRLRADCRATQQCGAPPQLAGPLLDEVSWRSPAYGFTLEYAGDQWKLANHGAAGVELSSRVAPVDLVIEGLTPGASAAQIVRSRVSRLKGNILALTGDPAAADAILGAGVGYLYGDGGAFVGAVDTPQGVQDQVFVTVQAATTRRVGIVATTLTNVAKPSLRREVYSLADAVINSVTWPGAK